MQFVCRVGAPDGRVFEDVFNAVDESALRKDLEGRGFHVFDLHRRGLFQKLSVGALRRGSRKVPPQEFLVFNQELAALLRAGLPLLQTLDLMLERMKSKVFRPVLSDIRDRVRTGEELSAAFEAYGEVFPRLYAPSLKAGERSGELEQVLRRFSRYLQLMLDSRRKVISALVYPAVLVGLSIVMLMIMAIYVVPSFTQFYEGLDGELPMLTQITVGISSFLRDHLLIVVGLVIVFFLAVRSWRRTERGLLTLDRWKLKVPFVGPIFHRLAQSEFLRSQATLLTGGIPLLTAFEIAVGAVGNASVRKRIWPTIQRVREGEAFYEALEKSEAFDDLAIDMVKVGEATGSLDEMLASIADFLDEQVETRLQRLLALMEPVMLVFMGVIIGLILVSLYLPMFSVVSASSF